MEEFVKTGKTVCILINKQGRIYYSNIGKDVAEKCLEDIHIFDHLPADGTVSYNVGYYTVTADTVDLNETHYYLILIQPQGDIYRYAYRDSLTGLYNRNYWEQLKSGALDTYPSHGFALIIIDVDNLKYINDNKGHLAGDKAIRIVGKSIRESIRKQDIAIRYGGDEFFILLANTKKAIVEKVINRIKENIRKRGKEENIRIEISAGTACSDCTCEMEKVITIADSKLYKEKAGKKVKARQITDELLELKQKIETVRDELKNKVIWKPNGSVDKELMEVNIKLEQMIKNYSKDVQ